jgi:hypothetical protein
LGDQIEALLQLDVDAAERPMVKPNLIGSCLSLLGSMTAPASGLLPLWNQHAGVGENFSIG